jgi:hypothetical protein
MDGEAQRWFFAGTNTGLSDHLSAVLRDPLREYLPNETEYERTFDWFEYLLCLVHCDVQVSLICCARTSDSRHNTLPRCENVESLHTSCDTVVRLPFCRRESMFR